MRLNAAARQLIPAWYLPAHTVEIPPAPRVFDQLLIDMGAIEQEHAGNGAPVLVLAVGLERNFLSKDQS